MEKILAGHYQIVRHLGGGGFGQTFLAHDTHLPGNPLCVVKQLQPKVTDLATLQTAKRLFNREAETLYRLGGHDQIPRLLAHFEQDHEFYLVQEFIEGHPLNQELIPGQKLSEPAVIALLQDILHVLAFVHQQNVIHRDIKPANLIRRSRDNKIILIDFGAVKEVGNQAASVHGQTNLTVAIGSPGYMPSEQQCFNPHFSSDIYALGLVAIQALTGLSPRDLPKDPQTHEYSCTVLKDLVSIDPGLAKILDQMVRYDFRQRYENAMIALQALQQLSQYCEPTQTIQQCIPCLTPTVEPLAASSGSSKPSSEKTKSNQLSTQLQDLPEELKHPLEQLLGEAIGPMASIVLKRSIEVALTYEELIDRLAAYCPESERTRFREQAKLLLKNRAQYALVRPTNQVSMTVAPPSISMSPAASAIDPGFIKSCEVELAKSIGPIAPLIVQRTLSQQPELSRLQLIETLAKHVPNPSNVANFRQSLLALI